MTKSKNALVIATTAKLASRLPQSELSRFAEEFSAVLRENRDTPTYAQINDSVIRVNSRSATHFNPKDPLICPPRPTASLLSNLAVSVFGYFWGKTMWGISSRSNSQFREMMHNYGKENAGKLREKFICSRRIGLSLFLLLSGDLLASYYFQYLNGTEFYFGKNRETLRSKKEIKEGELTTIYPVVQTGVFTLITIFLIHSYRFVMVPLLVACAYNHYDVFKHIPGAEEYIIQPYKQYKRQTIKTIREEISRKFPNS